MDGGTGSELQRRGITMSKAAWSGAATHRHPELIQQIHEDYIAAGARVLTTNTFGSARFVLEAAGLGEQTESINATAVAVAQRARAASGARVDIAGSISNLPPNMDANAYPSPTRELADLKELARLLADNGVDVIATEMLQHPEHGKRAMEAALATGLPVWLGVSCRQRADGELVCFDPPYLAFEAVLRALIPMGPAVVNVMHSSVPALTRAIALVRSLWDGPIGVYPEVPYGADAAKGPWSTAIQPDDLARLAADWLADGARLVGGCCGTTPDHIRALARVAAAFQAS